MSNPKVGNGGAGEAYARRRAEHGAVRAEKLEAWIVYMAEMSDIELPEEGEEEETSE